MNKLSLAILSAVVAPASIAAQQYSVVPSNRTTTSAPAYGWIAGASRDVRQQTLIGASHLTALVGKSISAIQLRRHSANEQYLGGTADLTVTLSISPLPPIECSPIYANNTGTQGSAAFSGQVVLPTSPAPNGGPIGWSSTETVEIQFTNPFIYTGGTLCIDIVGLAVPGQNANWWMANLELEDIGGTLTDLGGGCGIYGSTNKQWSSVSRRSLLAGSYARFYANGTPGAPGLAAFGNSAPVGIPLSVTGIPAGPSCNIWLASLNVLVPITFSVPTDPIDIPFGGEAEVMFKVPNSPTMLGVTMTTQWIDWGQLATSNAIEWSIAPSMPTIDMALIEGDADEASGLAAPYMGHVMRFTYL
ncbi:MAG: hypothetical protein ACJAQZ_004352 [Planctomycetota bacterium]|jgi:hypothetical protein